MTVLVGVETLLLILLSLLVVGLLRSHAEVLRRFDGLQSGTMSNGHPSTAHPAHPADLPGPRPEVTPAHDISGQTLSGDAIQVSPRTGANTLIAFLSSGCFTCLGFWEGLRGGVAERLPHVGRVVVVVKDPDMESPSKLRELAPDQVPVVMSSAAWEAYGIPMSPYFVYVDGPSGQVWSEGSASSWDQVGSLLRDAVADYEIALERGRGGPGTTT